MIELTREYTRSAAARAVPGAFFEDKAWRLENPDARSACVALKLFPELMHTYPELVELRDSTLQDAKPVDYATPYWESLGSPTSIGATRVEAELSKRGWAWKQGKDADGQEHWQLSDLTYAAACLRQHKAFYLGWSRGMGKTLATAGLIDTLNLKSTLIVAPNSAKSVTWADELAWALPHVEVITLANDAAKRKKCLERAQYLHRTGERFVLVVHYEALAVIAGKPEKKSSKSKPLGEGWKKLKIHWDLKAADEGHRFANPDSLQSRAGCKIPADMRLVLSGSVFQNKWEEVYGPLHFLFPDRYKSRWRDWNNRFFDYVENGYGKVNVGLLPDRVDAMRDELGRFMVVRDKLNKAAPRTVSVALSSEQRRVYDSMVETLFAELPDGSRLKSGVGIALLTRLRQIACGLDTLCENVEDSSKLDATIEVIRNTWDRGDTFVVFGWYKASMRALQRRLNAAGIEACLIDGDVTNNDRARIVRDFQNGKYRVLIGTLATMSESMNLQAGNHVIRVDRSFNPAMNQQAADRCDRQGQTRTVYLTDIVAENTVDDLVVLPNLANKDALRGVVFGGTS